MEYVRELIRDNAHFIKYSLIGGIGVSLDMVLFVALTRWLLWPYLIANTVSVSVGITNNFFFNAYFNFRTTDKLWQRYASFFSVGLFGLLLSSCLLFVLINIASLSQITAKALTIGLVAIAQYALNKNITFRRKVNG
ncbi:MAG: GtrA family protein [Negativicutes bacterium]|nr:GtrA family protein [Negativicutes bacterium]